MSKRASRQRPKKKPAKTAPKKTGRPPKKWTPAQLKKIEELAADNCTQTEIAEYLDCCQKTVSNRLKEDPNIEDDEFLLAYKKGRAQFVIELRQTQASIMRGAKAPKSQVGMCIWLGKQELEQRESPIKIEANNRNFNYDLTGLDDEQLKQLEALILMAKGVDDA